ncbi:MAG: glycosyltransferase family 2 protein [Deltaproteobacteria bacterium]|nr:glycosyltransferase family 2 protein [Deltaproteobacteria bacterium]
MTASTHVLIPAYNAGRSLATVLGGVLRHQLPVTVVNDGSSDDTAAQAQRPGVALLHHPENRGKGWAILTGVRSCLSRGAGTVICLDADGQHDPADIPKFLQTDADLAIGMRNLTAPTVPALRRFSNGMSTLFVSRACGVALPDAQCGFRRYSRRLLEEVPLRGGRYESETALLIDACRVGYSPVWVPIATRYEGVNNSHYRTFRDTIRIARLVIGAGRPAEQINRPRQRTEAR